MSSSSMQSAVCILVWMVLIIEIQGVVFDIKRFGAIGDGRADDNRAFMNAWAEACKSPEANQILVPKGTYLVGAVKFHGPCKGPIELHMTGATLKAPPEIEKFRSIDSWFGIEYVDRFTINGGIFDGQGELAWKNNDCAKTGKCSTLPVNLRFNFVKHSALNDVTSLNSKLFHVFMLGCTNFTLTRTTINAPEKSLNTDGIHIGRSTDIKILTADIKTGDDCISFGDGCKTIYVEKASCGPGHGISVGSLGRYRAEEPVVGIIVKNCTITNTMNGVRIKTWPASPDGIARDIHFEDIIMNNVGNPVLIDQEYCPYGECKAGVPSKIKVSDVTFKNIRGTSSTKMAVKLVCSKGLPCDNIEVGDINLVYHGPEGDAVSHCANVKPKFSGKVFPPPCAVV